MTAALANRLDDARANFSIRIREPRAKPRLRAWNIVEAGKHHDRIATALRVRSNHLVQRGEHPRLARKCVDARARAVEHHLGVVARESGARSEIAEDLGQLLRAVLEILVWRAHRRCLALEPSARQETNAKYVKISRSGRAFRVARQP